MHMCGPDHVQLVSIKLHVVIKSMEQRFKGVDYAHCLTPHVATVHVALEGQKAHLLVP